MAQQFFDDRIRNHVNSPFQLAVSTIVVRDYAWSSIFYDAMRVARLAPGGPPSLVVDISPYHLELHMKSCSMKDEAYTDPTHGFTAFMNTPGRCSTRAAIFTSA